jgi:hypothetical protein
MELDTHLRYYHHHNVVKNADNPPELPELRIVSARFCSLSRFFLSMSCSPDFLLFFKGLLSLVELAAGVDVVDMAVD